MLAKLFRRRPMSEKKIARAATLASNPHAQPDVRMRELERLLTDGSHAALLGALKRFGQNASGGIADEEEKHWLEDALVSLGDAALPALSQYIGAGRKIAYALRAYRRISGDAAVTDLILISLTKHPPEDHRGFETKEELLAELEQQHGEERVLTAMLPFLVDHNDEIRWRVMDILAQHEDYSDDQRATIQEHLAYSVSHLDVSPRIAGRAAALIAEKGWQVPSDTILGASLTDRFFVDKKGFLRMRQAQRISL